MHDLTRFAQARLERYLREFIRPAEYAATVPLALTAWVAPGEPVPFAQARAERFEPFAVGQQWGRPWGTVWFHITGRVPDGWTGDAQTHRPEALIDLGFDYSKTGFQCEGLAYRPDGTIVKAIQPPTRHLPVNPADDGVIDYYIEAAANPDIAAGGWTKPTALGDLGTAGTEPLYVLRQADVALLDLGVQGLLSDIGVLDGLARQLPPQLPRRAEIVAALDAALDRLDPHDVGGTAGAARAALAGVLDRPAYASAHTVYAVGNAHIDCAWLWPVRETIRKCARTFSNAIDLAEREPDFAFACSSAQQFAWIEDNYSDLFARLRRQVAEGRFIPVGGMWVEPDMNLAGGEALARQLVMGKRYFLDRFGIETRDVWLPDTFGYSAALPQLIKASGSRWFMTQKISWNDTNTMPHHTFWWEGIDGTRVFTHFPPSDTYSASLAPAELARAEQAFREKGQANTSLMLYGYGDGGGGPTREMVAAGQRQRDLEGSPRLRLATPTEFFEAAAAEYPNAPVWQGELYLEFHRGTLTSQALTKQGNRRNEHLLREAELWAATATIRHGLPYPAEDLAQLWREVLLLQFHDILPGSSIAWVHREAEQAHAHITERLTALIEVATSALVGEGERQITLNASPFPTPDGRVAALSGAAWPDQASGPGGRGEPDLIGAESADDASPSAASRAIQAQVSGAGRAPANCQVLADGSAANPAAGQPVVNATTQPPVPCQPLPDGGWRLDNGLVRLDLTADGVVSAVHDLVADRAVIPPGARANLLQLHRDVPSDWEAWNLDRDYRRHSRDIDAAESVEPVTAPDGAVGLAVRRSFGASRAIQRLWLTPDSPVIQGEVWIDWHERHTICKLAWPLDIHAREVASEIQFGHVWRPTHANTSWDEARFETVAQRWVYVPEPGYAVGIANDSTYGYDIGRDSDGEGHTTTTVRLSLLRAPVFPDPQADQGEHTMRYSIRLGADLLAAVADGYSLNCQPRTVQGASGVDPIVVVDNPAIVIEAVKLADDGSGDLVVRLYEALGGKARGRLVAGFAADAAWETDLLERRLPAQAVTHVAATDQPAPASLEVALDLHPFQIVTLRLAGRSVV